jgi:hypothetical protein
MVMPHGEVASLIEAKGIGVARFQSTVRGFNQLGVGRCC